MSPPDAKHTLDVGKNRPNELRLFIMFIQLSLDSNVIISKMSSLSSSFASWPLPKSAGLIGTFLRYYPRDSYAASAPAAAVYLGFVSSASD